MSFATFSGPVRVGTVKEGPTTNTGLTVLSQSKAVAYGDITAQTAAFRIPAGSMITGVQHISTTAYTTTAPTFTIFVNGTQVSAAGAGALVGAANIPLGTNSAAGATLVANVGTADALVAFTQVNGGGGTGAGHLIITYVQRADNGAQAPTSA